MRQMRFMVVLALVTSVTACGDDAEGSSESSVGTLEQIRGGEVTDGWQRVVAGEEHTTTGLTRLRLDAGPRLLLEGASFTLALAEGAPTLTLLAGRAFMEVLEGDALTIRVGDHVLQLRDTQASISADGDVYVVRGEIADRLGESDERQVIAAGERMSVSSGAIEAATLWDDWTGGLAEPGPGLAEEAAIGALEGRVPDEIGQARWPLVIRRLEVRVRVVENLAITEVDEIFFNPASETVEGLYRIRVPEGAVLQRFAVDRNGRMVDGYVREKAQAQQAYEAQVYRGSTLDPALLEWVAPGRYRARIYPIAAGEERRISVRYAEWLERPAADGPRVYRFPMGSDGDAPRVQELSFEADLSQATGVSSGTGQVRVGSGAEIEGGTVRLRQSDVRPRADIVIEIPDASEGLVAWRAAHAPPARDPRAGQMPDEDEDDYLYIPVVLPESLFEDASDQGLDLVVVADVSAGTDRSQLELGRSMVESITAHLTDADRVAIVASDVTLRPLGGDAALGPASRDRIEALLEALAREPSGGATDLGGALTAAAALLQDGDASARNRLVVYVGDGAPTVGELGAEALLQRLSRLPQPLRAYAVAVGDDAQLDLLEAITRGGGLAMRVETRAGAGEAALRLMAHARRPVAQRVEVTLEGADQVFPRVASDVVRGGVLSVVARVDGPTPSAISVRGLIGGAEFSETLALTEKRVSDEGDLRLRWAGERLRQLLLGGGRREEIADLGVRYGLITPYTSFYVPSAAEMGSLGDRARPLWRDESAWASRDARPSRGTLALGSWLPLLSAAGCSLSDSAPEPGPASGEYAEATPVPMEPSPSTDSVGTPEEAQAQAEPPMPPASAAPVTPEPDPSDDGAPEQEEGFGGLGLRGTGRGGGGSGEGTIGLGNLGTIGHGGGSGSGNGYGRGAGGAREGSMGDAPSEVDDGRFALDEEENSEGSRAARRPAPTRPEVVEQAVTGSDRAAAELGALGGEDILLGLLAGANGGGDEDDRGSGPRGGSISSITTTTRIDFSHSVGHTRRRCSDAADLLLDRRRELWEERLGAASGTSGLVNIYRTAISDCEAPRWRDRRALLDAMLSHTHGVEQMIALHRAMSDGSARSYLRGAVLRRVRTPSDLSEARKYFGSAHDAALVEQVLARAGEGPPRIRALRRLVAQFPGDIDLKLMLLEALESGDRIPEARHLAQALRADPMTDAGVRTAIGEMYLRLDDEAEARRVFGEIVEFSPQDALARRRLGDLYRAHGWFEDAYRQYQTLATITPDDPSVSLLLAQAAAGAGRVDEALRLEQRLAETAQPGAAEGLARTALLWSSVRFAELRAAAREAGNTEQLEELRARMRRSGVLRQAVPLRVTLVWSHPEAGLSLYGGYPGGGLTRPTHIAPEYGLEAFEAESQEAGTYRFEVRRGEGRHLTAMEGKLVVVWDEGTAEERVSVIPVRFEGQRTERAFTVDGRELSEVSR